MFILLSFFEALFRKEKKKPTLLILPLREGGGGVR